MKLAVLTDKLQGQPFAPEATDFILVTARGCKVTLESETWFQRYNAQHKTMSDRDVQRIVSACCKAAAAASDDARAVAAAVRPSVNPTLRPCQQLCLKACAQGARVVEMACGTGKTRIMRELAENQSGTVTCILRRWTKVLFGKLRSS